MVAKNQNKGWLTVLGLGLASYLLYSFTRKPEPPGEALQFGLYIDPFEVVQSDTADAQGISSQYDNVSNEVWTNAKKLAVNVINPALFWLENQSSQPLKLVVNSWFRSPELNEAVGGAEDSDHLTGRAADIELYVGSVNRNDLLVRAILGAAVPFDQLIIEEGTLDSPGWIHVSYNEYNNREQILRIDNGVTTVKTRQWAENYYS